MIQGTRGVSILNRMRKSLVFLALLSLALPAAGLATLSSKRANDGTLSVESGDGRVVVQARGAAIGRLERGTLTIIDTTPNDPHEPVVSGLTRALREVGENGTRYTGSNIRFRIIGGGFRIVLDGRGIDLSVVGRGFATLKGDAPSPGLYSLAGADCRAARSACEELPEVARRFQLGEKPERD
jgi:hypothetical protein